MSIKYTPTDKIGTITRNVSIPGGTLSVKNPLTAVDLNSESYDWITGPGENPVATKESSEGVAGGSQEASVSSESVGDIASSSTKFTTPDGYKDPSVIVGKITNEATTAMETPAGAVAALKAGSFLTRMGRDEYGFYTDRIVNIAGYITYLKKACSEEGLFAAKIKRARTA